MAEEAENYVQYPNNIVSIVYMHIRGWPQTPTMFLEPHSPKPSNYATALRNLSIPFSIYVHF